MELRQFVLSPSNPNPRDAMNPSNLIAMLQSGRPVYVQIPGHPPLRINAVEVGFVEMIEDVVLGWCRDATHPYAVQANVLKAESQADAAADLAPRDIARLEGRAMNSENRKIIWSSNAYMSAAEHSPQP